VIGTAIGNRYAKALLSVALEHDSADDAGKELEGLQTWLNENTKVRAFFSLITAEKQEKRSVMLELLPHLGLSTFVGNLVRLLADNGRLHQIDEVVDAYRGLFRENQGILGVDVATAAELEDQERDEIRQAIAAGTGKEIILEESVDPEIIGGLRYRIGSTIYDGSVRSQLSQLKRSLMKE
jgi:F-type H+-transporting ATPase subunit delta